jgi:tRNA (cmo5U34)-methyltransferase|tara:strand:+ start:7861 stop:8583 length:723 start_codon:yes stop_codon:yes gene_type:complete
MKELKKDKLYKKKFPHNHKFTFNNEVANVFEDMVNRSVPGYDFLVDNIGVLSKNFYQANTNIFDLGSSLCSCSLSALEKIDHFNGKIFAVDSSKAMIDICKKNINREEIKFINSDVCEIDINNASIVILNLTLQFIDIKKRENLLKKLFLQLNKNGVIIITEKITLEKESDDIFFKKFHDFYKENNGYTKEEIDRKKIALEKTMIIESEQIHENRFLNIGCENFYKWFQCYNFVSWILIK